MSSLRALLALGPCLAAACIPLPIPHTAQVTPSVLGTLLRDDGSPSVGTRVAAADAWKDPACARPAARARTDSAGRFRLPAGRVRRRIFWLSWFENFGLTSYALCVGPGDSVAGAASRPHTRVHGRIAGDTVACFEWAWQDRPRVTCSSQWGSGVQTGGSWRDADAQGWYRLIVAEEDGDQPGVFLQWLQLADSGPPAVVRETLALPLAPKLLALNEAKLWLRSGRPTCVSVSSVGRPRSFWSWRGPEPLRVALELGPPGRTRAVRSCADDAAGGGG